MQGLATSLTTSDHINRGSTEVSANRACLIAAGCFWAQLFVSVYARHNTQDVVVHRVHTHLGRGSARHGARGEHQLENGVVNAREVARSAGLVLLRAQGKGVHVDARVRGAGVVLVGLDHVKVRALTLREAVLAVELQLGRDDRVLTPAVHVQGGLREHKGAGVGHVGALRRAHLGSERQVRRAGRLPGLGAGDDRRVRRTRHLKHTRGHNEVTRGRLRRATKRVDGVGQGVNGVRVVERLRTQGLEQDLGVVQGRAVVHVGVRLDNPDELLARVVEVELDLVRGGTDRLVTRELHLLNQVLVRVLGHLAALIRVQEHIVHVEGRRHQRLLVRHGGGHGARAVLGRQGLDGPEALANRADVQVDLDLVVLQRDERERETRVAVPPEHERDVQGGLRERVARGAHLGRSARGRARARDGRERGVRDVGQLGRVANHLEVATLLLRRHGELIPDVHPVTVLAVNALATNLHLHLSDELLTNEVQPAGIDTVRARGRRHGLVDLRESHLQVGAVSQVTVAGDRAGHTAAKVGLAGEGLLDGLHREVRVASVRHLPESNLGGSSEEDVLGSVRDELQKTTSHFLGIVYSVIKEKIMVEIQLFILEEISSKLPFTPYNEQNISCFKK